MAGVVISTAKIGIYAYQMKQSILNMVKCFVIALVLSSGASKCQTWRQIEIPMSACSFIAQNPWAPDQLFFMHHGVIAISSDTGNTWDYRGFSEYVDARPVSITFDAEDPNRWYLPMGPAGLMITTNGGQSFSFKNRDLNPLLEYLEVVQHPENMNILYLRGNGVIQKSTDRGETWNDVLLQLKINTEEASGLIIDDDEPYTLYVYASGRNRYYVSSDGGSNWENKWIEPGLFTRITKCTDGSIWGNNARSTDNGNTWVRYKRMEGLKEDFIGTMCQVVYDEDHDYFFLAMSNFGVYRAKKNEWIWHPTKLARSIDSSRFGELSWMHFDHYSHTLWVVMRNELYLSRDDGESFEIVRTGPYLGSTSFFSSPSCNSNIIIGSTIATTNNGNTWQSNGWAMATTLAGAISPIDSNFIIKGTGRPLYTTYGFLGFENINTGYNIVQHNVYVNKTIKFNPHNPHELYGGSGRGFWRLTDSMIFRASQYDSTNRLLTPWPSDHFSTVDFDFHPLRDGEYYIATRSYNSLLEKNQCRIYQSCDYELSWKEIYREDGNVINAILVHPDSANIIICASDRGIIRSVDAGLTWQRCILPPFATAYIQSIVIDPQMPNIVYCGAFSVRYENSDPYTGGRRGGVYVSYNYGESWEETPMDGIYNYSVNCIHYHENPRRLIISTRAGIYERELGSCMNTQAGNDKPSVFELTDLYPNPISIGKSVTLKYSVDRTSEVTVQVRDLIGRTIQTLLLSRVPPGNYQLYFNPDITTYGLYIIYIAGSYNVSSKILIVN